MMTDPISDMLTRIRNANMVRAEKVDIPASKLKLEITKVLKEKGFIKCTIASGRRTHSTLYRSNSPEDALVNYFGAIDQLKDVTDQVVALLEQKYEQQGDKANDQNIWMFEPWKIALREGIKYLEGAKKSILMYCNNHSWIEEPGIAAALRKKMNEALDVRILGGPPPTALQRIMKKFNKIRKETSIPCTPYCIVDEEQLLIFLNDGFDPKLLATKNTYIVERHSAQFSKVWEEYSKEV